MTEQFPGLPKVPWNTLHHWPLKSQPLTNIFPGFK